MPVPATRLVSLSRISWFKLRAVAVIGAVAILGYVVTLPSFAAGPTAAFEPESGTLSAGATVASVTGASGLGVVRFNATTPPPYAYCNSRCWRLSANQTHHYGR
ncbi:hypothetical protein IPG36_00975 [bacterium]|nr:MAG: hypothetical protein IPG36_00975 [bacterium]